MPFVSRSPDSFQDDAASISLGRDPHRVELLPVAGVYAVGCDKERLNNVRETLLAGTFQVHQLPSRSLLLVHVSDRKNLDSLENQLRDLAAEDQVRFFTPVLRDVNSNLRQILTDEIAVGFKANVREERAKSILEEHKLVPLRRSEFNPRHYVARTATAFGLEAIDVSRRLDKAEGVEYATPNFIAQSER